MLDAMRIYDNRFESSDTLEYEEGKCSSSLVSSCDFRKFLVLYVNYRRQDDQSSVLGVKVTTLIEDQW
jgi:hypothetical protein